MASFEKANRKSITTSFNEFHKNNPSVYRLFTEQVFRAIRKRRNKISSKQILNWIRWEVSLELKTKDVYKINDAYTSRYSRLFIKEYPEHEELFDFRKLRTGKDEVRRPGDNATGVILSILNGGKDIKHPMILHYPTLNKNIIMWESKLGVKEQAITTIQFNKLFNKKLIRCISVRKEDKQQSAHNKLLPPHKSYVISKAGIKYYQSLQK